MWPVRGNSHVPSKRMEMFVAALAGAHDEMPFENTDLFAFSHDTDVKLGDRHTNFKLVRVTVRQSAEPDGVRTIARYSDRSAPCPPDDFSRRTHSYSPVPLLSPVSMYLRVSTQCNYYMVFGLFRLMVPIHSDITAFVSHHNIIEVPAVIIYGIIIISGETLPNDWQHYTIFFFFYIFINSGTT